MIDLHKIIDENGILVVEVTNDISTVQQHLITKN